MSNELYLVGHCMFLYFYVVCFSTLFWDSVKWLGSSWSIQVLFLRFVRLDRNSFLPRADYWRRDPAGLWVSLHAAPSPLWNSVLWASVISLTLTSVFSTHGVCWTQPVSSPLSEVGQVSQAGKLGDPGPYLILISRISGFVHCVLLPEPTVLQAVYIHFIRLIFVVMVLGGAVGLEEAVWPGVWLRTSYLIHLLEWISGILNFFLFYNCPLLTWWNWQSDLCVSCDKVIMLFTPAGQCDPSPQWLV